MQLTDSKGAGTLDKWTDSYCKSGYLCATLHHHLNNKREVTEHMPCTCEWDSTLPKRAAKRCVSSWVSLWDFYYGVGASVDFPWR